MNREYRNIHDWVRRRMNHIIQCQICGNTDSILDNALIHGKQHEKNIDNYQKLCRKCHYNYDHPNGFKHSEESLNKIGIASSDRIKRNGVNPNFINSKKGKCISENHKKSISESMKGENHHQSKLTENQVIDIFNSKESTQQLSDYYKVNKQTIRNIKSKKTWKHLF